MLDSSAEHKPLLNRQLFSKPIVRLPVWISLSVVFFLSILGIAGWVFNIPFFKSFSLQWVPIKPFTAIGLFIIAIALLINHLELKSRFFRILSFFIAGLICIAGLFTIFIHISLFNTGNESSILLRFPSLQPFISTDGRMPFLTSTGILLTGCILFLFHWKNKRNSAIAHFLIFMIYLITYYAIASYILGMRDVTGFNGSSVSLHCILSLCAIGVAVLSMRPDTWLMKFYTIRDTAGIITRRLLILAILVPIAIGWIRLHGEKTEFFTYEEGVIIAATFYAFLLIILTWIIAVYIRKIDKKRATTERALINSEKRYHDQAIRLEVISKILNSSFSLSDEAAVGNKCLDMIKDLIPCESGFIALLTNNVLLTVAATIPEEKYSQLRNSIFHKPGKSFQSYGIFAEVLIEGKTIVTNSPSKQYISFLPKGHPPLKSVICVPLIHSKKTIGMILLANRLNGFSKTDQETMELIAPFIGEAIVSKQAEKALRISEEKFRNMVKYAPTVIFEMDMRGTKFFNVNNTGYEILGYTSEELYSVRPVDLLDSKSILQFKELVLQKLTGGLIDESLEYNVKKKNGEWLSVLVNIGKVVYPDEPEPNILVIAYDITMRKKLEKNLEESEKKFRELVRFAPTAIYEVDFINQKFLTINDATCLMTGYTREELLSMNVMDLLTNDSKQELLSRISKIHEGETPPGQVEYKVIRKDGQIINAVLNMKFHFDENGKPYGALVVGHDITERKMAQEALSESELKLKENVSKLKQIEKELIATNQKYEELLTNARSIIVKIDTDGICTYINEYGLDFFNFDMHEIAGKPITETIVPQFESTGRNLKKLIDRIKNDPDRYSININENQKKNGERVWIEWHNKATYDKNNKKTGYIAIGIDISARKRTEADLKESKAKLLSVLNATQESIYMLDINGTITMSNSTGLRRLNKLSDSEIIGHNIRDFMPEPVAKQRIAKLEEVISTRKPIKFDDSNEGRNFTHNYFPVFKDNNVTSVVIYSRDITKRKRAESRLRENEAKLRDVVATKDKFFNIVAHDLKNPFTSMLGSTELLLNNINDLDKKNIHELSSILYDSAKSGYAILQNLLDWSRSQTGLLKINNENINLRTMIDENISALQLAISKKEIKIYSRVNEDIPIFADKNMINTILRNILSNAVKFTHRTGQINISVNKTHDLIIVSVKDSGIGIPADKIQTLFRLETKHFMPGTANEQGTGLGLKLTKEFVEKLGGTIWVESQPGKGSDFRFSIPLRKE